MNKEDVIEAIKWSEQMTTKQAEYTYSVTSERYHTAIHNLYVKHLKRRWKELGWYHPIYNPMNEREKMLEKAKLKLIIMELILSQ
jgi:hypothetical protein